MLSIERLELLPLEVRQVVELEHFQNAFECPIKQVFLDAAHLILFNLLSSEIVFVGRQSEHLFVASLDRIKLSVNNETVYLFSLAQAFVSFNG